MVNFRNWLNENERSRFDHFKDIILNYLNLDQNKGLSQSLDGFNRQNLKARLQGLREFSSLPISTQQKILAMIDSAQGGTVGDLIRQMTGMPQQVKYNANQDLT